MPKKHNRKIKGQKLNRGLLISEVLKYLRNHPQQSLTARQLIKRLKVGNDKSSMEKALKSLSKAGKVSPNGESYQATRRSGKTLPPPVRHLTGQVDVTRSGDAYIILDAGGPDVLVKSAYLGSAMNGDTVEIETFGGSSSRPKGRVLNIISRSTEQFIGTFYRFKRYGVVVADNAKVPFDILVASKDAGPAEPNDKVIVEIKDWSGHQTPRGRIIHVFGGEGSSEIAMQSILLMNGFNMVFPPAVLEEMKSLPAEVQQSDLEGRRDFREVTTVTIDPRTAKDFDDALSIQTLSDGTVEVGVHIADVTHFVRPGTEVDKEAFRRSTSVYLVDRVAPMLPEQLSNELCSLRPYEESLCFSAVFKFGLGWKVQDRWFGKTVIFSDHRFAYEEAQEVLETGKGKFAEELVRLNEIAHALRQRKLKHGALAFESDEIEFELNEDGVPTEIRRKERKDAHLLVEDFMLLANREVAIYLGKTRAGDKIPFVYRIHDTPDPEKLEELASFARLLGFKMEIDTPAQVAHSFNELSKAAREDESLAILEPLAIRSMAKAEYHPENIGHYGLAFPYYTHFTSPIRRYSDVLVHRILYDNLVGRSDRMKMADLKERCKHISQQERKALKAERESVKYKLAEFMQQHVGGVFSGRVSGMIDRGLFVKLDANHAEGMVGFNTFNEPFELDQAGMVATAMRSGHKFKLGDQLTVRVLSADPEKRQIEFLLAEEY